MVIYRYNKEKGIDIDGTRTTQKDLCTRRRGYEKRREHHEPRGLLSYLQPRASASGHRTGTNETRGLLREVHLGTHRTMDTRTIK